MALVDLSDNSRQCLFYTFLYSQFCVLWALNKVCKRLIKNSWRWTLRIWYNIRRPCFISALYRINGSQLMAMQWPHRYVPIIMATLHALTGSDSSGQINAQEKEKIISPVMHSWQSTISLFNGYSKDKERAKPVIDRFQNSCLKSLLFAIP